jgi:hypothetical protein
MPCHADVTEPRHLKIVNGTPLPLTKAMTAFLSGTDHGCTGGNPIPDEPGRKAGMACFLAFWAPCLDHCRFRLVPTTGLRLALP